MNWRDLPSLSALRAFEAAARLHSLSAAARELNVTHAAVAQHVRMLEDHFGTGLLSRQGRSMMPTPEGQQLAAALTAAFNLIATAARELRSGSENRALRIAVTPSFAANWLMPRIGGFWAAHPDIELEILPGVDLVDLRADAIDVAIRYGKGGWPGVASELLVRADMVAVAAPKVVAGRNVTCLADLSGTTWLVDSFRSEERYFALQNGIDLDREKVITFTNAQLAREAALAGLGVTILPDPLIAGEIASGRVVELCRETESPVAYHILTRPGVIAPRRDIFVKWLRKEAAS